MSKVSPADALKKGTAALLVVDVQWDFCKQTAKDDEGIQADKLKTNPCPLTDGGSLGCAGTNRNYLDSVGNFVTNARSKKTFKKIYWSQDFHPENHCSLQRNNKDVNVLQSLTDGKGFPVKKMTRKNPSDNNSTDEEFTQIVWFDHCVQGSKGADICIPVLPDEFVQTKGLKKDYDSYSAFCDDGGMKTGLLEKMKADGVESVFLLGIATDVCVYNSAKDAIQLDGGFGPGKVYVIQDLCRGVFDESNEFKTAKIWCDEKEFDTPVGPAPSYLALGTQIVQSGEVVG